jgi:hypothetical protein
MSIYRSSVHEHTTPSHYMYVVVPFPEIEYIPANHALSLKFRGYASLYRESLNSNTPAYSFLCLYRIIEGLFNDRDQRGRAVSEAGQPRPTYRSWRDPEAESQFIPWLLALYRGQFNRDASKIGNMFPEKARGMKITRIKGDILEPLRNRIAHSMFGDLGSVPWEENLVDIDEIEQWLPLTQMIVRRLLKDEYPTEFLAGMPDDGLDDLCKSSEYFQPDT